MPLFTAPNPHVVKIFEPMTRTENILKFGGPIVAQIIYKDNGNIELRKFAGPILGTFTKSSDTVKKFRGPIMSSGCGPSPLFSLIHGIK